MLQAFTDYSLQDPKTIELDEKVNKTRYFLSKNLIKFLVWSMSKISHSFIKVDQTGDDEDIHHNLLKSRLLSGGLKNRFLSIFDKKSYANIESLSIISGDDKLMDYLAGPKKIDKDNIFEAIIHKSKDEAVDRLLELLQWNLARKNPMAKAGGDQGMILCRCAFVGMLALNQK